MHRKVTLCASTDQPYSMYVYESQVYFMACVMKFCLVVAAVVALTSK
jgi:hypothetical protein